MGIEILDAQPDEMRRIRDRLLSINESHIIGEAKKELGRDIESLIRSLIHGTTNHVKLQDEQSDMVDEENSIDEEEEASVDEEEEEEEWEPDEESVDEESNAHESLNRLPTPIPLMKHLKSTSRKSSISFSSEPLIDRLAKFFPPFGEEKAYDEDEIEDVAWLLKRLDHTGHESPRTYILLRIADRLEEMEFLLKSGFNDFHLPVSSNYLPHSITFQAGRYFFANQHLVMTKGNAFERKIHCHYIDIDDASFKSMSLIAQSNFNVVTKIQSIESKRVYVLKRMPRAQKFEGFQHEVRTFINDVNIVRAWNHRHLIRLEGTLTTTTHFGIVMSPVADSNLQDLLDRSTEFFPSLQSAYGCLASAIDYLHKQRIHHGHLHPKAILISDGKVVLSEMIMSSVFLSVVSASQRLGYLAPEMVAREPSSFAAHIWSLGCIFLEITVVLQGHSIKWLRKYFKESGDKIHAYREWPDHIQQLLGVLKLSPNEELTQPLECIERMLNEHPQGRPTASQVAETIIHDQRISPNFCGSCCRSAKDASRSEPKEGPRSLQPSTMPENEPLDVERSARSDVNRTSVSITARSNRVVDGRAAKYWPGEHVRTRRLFITSDLEVVSVRHVSNDQDPEYQLRRRGSRAVEGLYRDGKWFPEKDLKQIENKDRNFL